MADYITEINADGDLATALTNFNTVCAANSLPLGLAPADLTEIAGAATGFNTDLTAWIAAKASAEGVKTTKNTQKGTSKAIISKWAKVFRAKVTVSDTLLAQLMLPPHSTPGTSTPPVTPTMLVATSDGLGNIRLSWNRTGNKQTTVFLIEYRASASDVWTFLANSTRVRFDTTWQPGTYVGYRVTAQRSGLSSAPSAPVVLWETGESMPLHVAA